MGLTDDAGYDGYNEPITIHPGIEKPYESGTLRTLRGPGRKAIRCMRSNFEPVREATTARSKARDARKRAQWLKAEGAKARLEAESARAVQETRSKECQEATRHFHEADQAEVKAKQNERDFSQRARLALDFSTRQLEQFENPEMASEQQSWEPLENGNNWRMIRLKRKTQLEAKRAIDERDEAHFAMFQTSMEVSWAVKEQQLLEERATYIEAEARKAAKYARTLEAMASSAESKCGFLPSISLCCKSCS